MAKQTAVDKKRILTHEQKAFLELLSQQRYFTERFYFTGGTPLAAFYLHHRISEDVDLFSEEEVHLPSVRTFLGKAQKELTLESVDYRAFYGLHSFQLFFPNKEILKVDFTYYPFPRIEEGLWYEGIVVDSSYDIAVNKVHTIAMNPRARDFIDVYFLVQANKFDMGDLLDKAKAKFDWHIDALQLASRFLEASVVKDFPRMLKLVDHEEWQQFFRKEAEKLKKDIFD